MPTPTHKILVVEDVQLAQKAAVAVLTQLHCHVTTVSTGQEAVTMVQTQHYDLIFMDLGLPDTDGLTVTHTIRNTPGYAKVPIIALTARDTKDIQRGCLNMGMDDFLIKPLTMENAGQVLAKYFI